MTIKRSQSPGIIRSLIRTAGGVSEIISYGTAQEKMPPKYDYAALKWDGSFFELQGNPAERGLVATDGSRAVSVREEVMTRLKIWPRVLLARATAC
jgi:hypothetical protein